MPRSSKTMMNNSKLPCYSVPSTKLKNVICVACKNMFRIPDILNLNGLILKGHNIPLLLDCGHPICNKCIQTAKLVNCPDCNEAIVNHDNNQKSLFPLNLYTLGRIVSSYHNLLENEDEEFQFCHKLSAQMRNIIKQGCCYECGNKVNVKCIQCTALYCHYCYAKIHGRALQNHIQIPIFDGDPNSPAAMLNSCSPTCTETLSYFCNNCNVASCSTCILRFHKVHKFVPLSEKNETLLPEFNEVCKHIEDTLLRVAQTSEKVKSALTSNVHELENSDAVEAKISQHFAYLHGVLQSMEMRLMSQLHQRTENIKNNLKDIQTQLQSQEESLGVMLKMASYAKQIYDKVDVQNTIQILKESTDLPCHLLHKDTGDNDKAMFTVDNSIVTYIKNHCTIQVPPAKSYSLVATDELPKNYIISPLKKKPEVSKILSELLIPPVTKISNASTASIKSENTENKENKENKEQEDTLANLVEVTCVINPSLFYVQKVASKSEFMKLETDLIKYGKESVESPITIEKDDMCIVKKEKKKEIKWRRGRVTSTLKIDNETKYCVFYIDYGYEERNIPSSHVRGIAEHLRESPPYAIKCCLHGIVSKNNRWTNKSINDFLKLTRESTVTMFVIESTPDMLYVDLCVSSKDNKMGPQSMCNTMKVMDYARLDNSQTILNTTFMYTKEELPLNKGTSVAISWIESPDEIYVTKLGQRKDKLSKVIGQLKEHYEKDTSTKTIDTLQKGLPCAVQLEDGTWQRGEIINVISADTVQVFCVDWGCNLILNRDCLREIPHKYTMYNAQAIRMSLMYIYPEVDGSWKSNAFSMLKSIFSRAKHVSAFPQAKVENIYKGLIFCDNSDISRLLKSAGVVNRNAVKFPKRKQRLQLSLDHTLPSLKNVNSIVKDDSSNNTTNADKPVEKNEITKDPFKMEVRVQQVITPDCIYVAQTEREKSNGEMMSAMQKFYNSYCSELRDNWSEGALCVVYSAKDKSYFRAKILKIKSLKEVLVFFYDMGIEETVMLKDIQILHQQFAKEAAYCFKIKLAGIWPCGGSYTWPSLSCITLSDIIRENAFCKFYITKPVQEEVGDDVVPVELWVKQTKIPGPLAPSQIEINSINRMLVDKGVALPIKNYFAKADVTLATEFKRQLESNHQSMLIEEKEEEEVKWLNKVSTDCKEINDTILSLDSSSRISSVDTFNDLINKYQVCDKTNQDCATEISQWLPPSEITEEVFHAIPTYVDNNCAVYLHPKKSSADVINYIESELQVCYKKAKRHIKKDKKWKEGDLCIAQYHHDMKWYRGRIVRILGNILKVEFVDYGNVEECEIEHVTDYIRLNYIPIQCTKCVISGLGPATESGKWLLHDLDRIHALLVDKVCKVSVLERLPTHLIVSITLLQPWKCDLLLYLANHMDMNIKIERKDWNDVSKDGTLDAIQDIDIEEVEKIPSERTFEILPQDATFNEHVISGNLAESSKYNNDKLSKYNNDKEISDIESMSDISLEALFLDDQLKCSTPQQELEEFFGVYKQLTIPQETKYIELILCCNDNPITSFAQLAENKDAIFPNIFHEYYLQYKSMMSDLQSDACHQPLIESFEKNTPCITKFSDNMWYRCIITDSEKIPDTQCIRILLVFVDYGNNECRDVDVFSKNHDLRVPKQEWLELPAMAIKCTFWGLNFIANDIKLLASKLNQIFNQPVVARIKEINNETDLVVDMFKDKTCKELLYAHLIKEGLYQFKKSKED
ncbi:RING finger protein 17 isoform X1 [Linepithema humile]|uniref:RING finger protein 17 isoform X1 n=2 Tax=Linepithema humile TaxID=83485 RepID=UPI00062367FB|nr:PREDICTED: RING finger protein 17-like isoform X2 [Linepithema humile]